MTRDAHQEVLLTTSGAIVPQGGDSVEAARRRDAGITAAIGHRGGRWDLSVIMAAIEHFAALGRPFSSADVRDVLPVVAPPAIGAAFRTAAGRGLIEPVGWTLTRHAEAHGRPVRVWRGIRP